MQILINNPIIINDRYRGRRSPKDQFAPEVAPLKTQKNSIMSSSSIKDQDIWFEHWDHPGSKDFKRIIRCAVEDFEGHEFSNLIFKSILSEIAERGGGGGSSDSDGNIDHEVCFYNTDGNEISDLDVIYSAVQQIFDQVKMERKRQKESKLEYIVNMEKTGGQPSPTSSNKKKNRRSSFFGGGKKGLSIVKNPQKFFTCTYAEDIDAPIEMVKEAVFDLKKCQDWDPDIMKVELFQQETTGVGCSRRCYYYDDSYVDETIIKETDNVSILVFDSGSRRRSIMRSIGSESTIEKISEFRTRLISRIYYKPKALPLTYCLASTVLKQKMRLLVVKHAQGKEADSSR